MRTSENIVEISKAMNSAQRSMRPALKDATNPHFRSKYSDLASVMESIREPIGHNGLSVWQDATFDEAGVNIITRIVHVSGQWVEFGPLTIPVGKRDAHAVGSACSYGKRYALCAALGVVSDEDDDGNKASQIQEKKRPNENAPKSSELVDNKVTQEQSVEFNRLLKQCGQEFEDKVWGHLRSQGINSFEEMSIDMFKKMRDASLGHISKKNQVVHASS
jgi:hypothetical protein